MTIKVTFMNGDIDVLLNAVIKKNNSKMLYIWYTDIRGFDTSIVYDPEKVKKVEIF